MSFDPDRLLGWQVPETRHRLTRRDTAFYALSTGWGDDPLDREALAYVDPGHPYFTASPAMALVLGYPGFWLGSPALGLDAGRILHVDQTIELDRQVPVEGDITGRVRLLELSDRGTDRGALLVSERELYCNDRPFGRVRQTHLLRSEGGFGGAPAPAASRRDLPSRPADQSVRLQIGRNAALLYRLNGDMNPIHANPHAAAAIGFDRPILHGMATFGFIVGQLVRQVAGRTMKRISMRFAAPVFPGDELRLDHWNERQFIAARADGTTTINQGFWSD